ncbi:MAG: septal ring lytic transglycosylase RlpA family protein [Hyphomicrobiaceae bacterium]|nr:septal ring lytic transglycosylase RlpA family protein [Hyphomicrobiaceae bacterium]
MRSLFKAAAIALALAGPLAVSVEASTPRSHHGKALRAPAARLEAPAKRYAAARFTLHDSVESWDDDEDRPRARRKATRPQAQRNTRRREAHRDAQAPRQARRQIAREWSEDGDERPVRRNGRRLREVAAYVPSGSAGSGIASYYWQGQRTASGAHFNPDGLTAAHRTLPFGTRVRVTNMHNGRSVDVTINDRGPFIAGRIIDLSRGAASVIGMTGQGLARVKMEVIGR